MSANNMPTWGALTDLGTLDAIASSPSSPVTFSVGSLVSSGNQSYNLAALLAFNSHAPMPAEIAVTAYDRQAYAGWPTPQFGNFSSPGGGAISAGVAPSDEATTLYFDYVNGQYVSRDNGDPLSSFQFTTSSQNTNSVYLSVAGNATTSGSLLGPGWASGGNIDVVTSTAHSAAPGAAATPAEIAAIASSFVGATWNAYGCWVLASNIAALAGTSLPLASSLIQSNVPANGQWQVVFNGATQTGNWRAMLQPGDIVELQYLDCSGHVGAIVSGAGDQALWVDNTGPIAPDGLQDDIVIQPAHSFDASTATAVDNTVLILRLSSATTSTPTTATAYEAPAVTGHDQNAQAGSAVTLSSLYTATDPSGLPITNIQIDATANDTGTLKLDGAVNLASAAQQAAGIVVVSAADAAKVQYVTAAGPGVDTLVITAGDGQHFGSVGVTVTGFAGPAPVVTNLEVSLPATAKAIPVSSLFSVSDPGGNAITQYRFIDTAALAGQNGILAEAYGTVNLATPNEAAQGIVQVAASDLGNVYASLFDGVETLSVSAFDGVQWSPFTTVTLVGQASTPVVTTHPSTIAVGAAVPLSSLITVTDPDGQPITQLTILDTDNRLQLNGATNLLASIQSLGDYRLSFSDLSKVTYLAPSAGLASFQVSAQDAASSSTTTEVNITAVGAQPLITAGTTTVTAGTSVALSSLFNVFDGPGSVITQYTIQDPAGGGVLLNGATNLATAAQQAQGIYVISAADLGKAQYAAGSSYGTENLTVSAFDGQNTGSAQITVTRLIDSPPVVTVPPVTLEAGQVVPLASLFSVTDPNGNPIQIYQFAAEGFQLDLNGAVNIYSHQQSDGVYGFSQSDLAKVTLVAGQPGVSLLQILVNDGVSNSNWGVAQLTVKPATPVTGITGPASVDDGANATFTIDLPNAGLANATLSYTLSGNGVGAADVGGSLTGTVTLNADGAGTLTVPVAPDNHQILSGRTLSVSLSDSHGDSWQSAAVAINDIVNPPPSVTAHSTTVALGHAAISLSSLCTVSPDVDGDPIVNVLFFDPTNSIQLNGATNLDPAQQSIGMYVLLPGDLSKAAVLPSSLGVLDMQISAYDGAANSATEDALITVVAAAVPKLRPYTPIGYGRNELATGNSLIHIAEANGNHQIDAHEVIHIAALVGVPVASLM